MQTDLTRLLGIEAPIVQGPFGPWTTVALSAAVSEAGGLGSIGAAAVAPERVREMITEMRERTDRPFAVNHTWRPLDEESFRITLEARPAVVSLALGGPGDLAARVHDVGARFMSQVTTVEQAVRAAEAGADVVIAQGAEAGGFGGEVSTMVLVPQVVDAIAPVPVLAAGGIADGRGLAAALLLGAQGVNVGTRFLTAAESAIPELYRDAVLGATSQDAVKVAFDAFGPAGGPDPYVTRPRAISTPFVERHNTHPPEDLEAVGAEIMAALRAGRAHELVPFAGQSAGLIDRVLTAREIVEGMVREATARLAAVSQAAAGVTSAA
ncbi:MAG TPA: nitronate monooxygenase [Solirubrobacteraceae bacterium]|nr:nitronate monooxygenase [Solirubrobacteraceae bacterium]